jgi:hypothetical protein
MFRRPGNGWPTRRIRQTRFSWPSPCPINLITLAILRMPCGLTMRGPQTTSARSPFSAELVPCRGSAQNTDVGQMGKLALADD